MVRSCDDNSNNQTSSTKSVDPTIEKDDSQTAASRPHTVLVENLRASSLFSSNPPKIEKTRLIGLITGFFAYYFLRSVTLFSQLILSTVNYFSDVKDRAPQRMDEEATILEVDDDLGKVLNLEKLPKPKEIKLQTDKNGEIIPTTIAFAGCANLCMYTLGVAYALSKAPNVKALKADGKLKTFGGSSGAIVGACFASEMSCLDMFIALRKRFIMQRFRVGGCIGVYTWGVRSIMNECYENVCNGNSGGGKNGESTKIDENSSTDGENSSTTAASSTKSSEQKTMKFETSSPPKNKSSSASGKGKVAEGFLPSKYTHPKQPYRYGDKIIEGPKSYYTAVPPVIARTTNYSRKAQSEKESEDVFYSNSPVLDTLKNKQLHIFLTRFNPGLEFVTNNEFANKDEFIDAVLASCLLPIAYETPIFYKDYGFILDGCLAAPPLTTDIVVSPYQEQLPDIGPDNPFPTTCCFNMLHRNDVLILFEKGYLDAVKWTENGCPTKAGERRVFFKDTKLGLSPLAAVTFAFVGELLGFKREAITGKLRMMGMEDVRVRDEKTKSE